MDRHLVKYYCSSGYWYKDHWCEYGPGAVALHVALTPPGLGFIIKWNIWW